MKNKESRPCFPTFLQFLLIFSLPRPAFLIGFFRLVVARIELLSGIEKTVEEVELRDVLSCSTFRL